MSAVPATAEGELARTPVAHLLVYALDHRLSGALFFSVEAGGAETVVQLDRGVPVKIKPADPSPRLGQMLIEAGAIDAATLEGALSTTGLLGDVLLLTDRIERDVLERVAEAQFRRRIVDLFALPSSATYRFYEDWCPIAEYGGDPSRVDPIALIWAGVRAHGECSALMDTTLARLGDTALRLHASQNVTRFDLADEERAVFDAIALAGSPSVDSGDSGAGGVGGVGGAGAKLADLTGLTAAFPSVARRFVYALTITRQLESTTGTLPLGVEAPPSSSQRNAPAASLGRVLLRSTVHRVGAAAPDAPGAGERPFVSRRGKSLDESGAAVSPRAASSTVQSAGAASEEHELASLSPEELLWLAAEYLEQSDAVSAVEMCAVGCARNPGDVDLMALHVWTRAHLDGADLRGLACELDALVVVHDAHADARFYRAMLLRRLGDDVASVRDLRRVVELVPDHEAARRALGTLSTPPASDLETSRFGHITGE